VAEGGGLLNRYTLSRRIEGSNPSLSASRHRTPRPPLPIPRQHHAAELERWRFILKQLDEMLAEQRSARSKR
jgi:hypothetical protein